MQQITRPHSTAISCFRPLHRAHDESRQIVFARRIKIRHLRRFAADQRAVRFLRGAAHSFDHLLHYARIQFAHRQVIEEKKRLGALRQNVVHAVVQNIRAHGGMNAGSKCDLQLGAHAVRAGDKHRIAPALAVKLEKRAEAANGRKHTTLKCFLRHRGNSPFGFVSNRNIHAGIGVTHEEVPFLKEGELAILEARIS